MKQDQQRAAAIDIGTNSVLLAIAERAENRLVPLLERATITRLGQGVDKTRTLAPEAVERNLACLADYADLLRDFGSPRLRVVGTSAMRDAAGGEDFRERAAQLLGVTPEVISGDEEAQLTYRGALSGLPVNEEPVVVFDIGGGSTEIIQATAGKMHAAVSLNIGSVRLTERHLPTDPPTQEELASLQADIASELAKVPPPIPQAHLIGVAGTLTTLCAVHQRLTSYDSTRVHGAELSLEQVQELCSSLAALPVAARRELPGLEPKRADVIAAGAQIALGVLTWAGAQHLTVSDRGVRWGILEQLLGS
ncbi:MAG: Ppx/GppA family phosphatase [Polyangiaceae bacterium]|nr:Ppx/GppA family phosphatase [Myxococcales bacterium]MCB9585484.1 Ppx/GppA family phosphatase [Polyangiaceae bacterium]MCB9606500.1 Ppx/GppA family phosphatase [Polyangiaceae bacterium]